MRFLIIFVLSVSWVGIFLVPGTAEAALVTCNGLDCDACKLADMVNGIIRWLIGAMVLVAVIMLVVAGFKLLFSRGNSEALASAKNMFVAVVIGFILVLSAWLIVDTILKGLTGTGLNALGPVTCGLMVPPEADEVPGGLNPTGAGGGVGAGGISDAEARALMERAGIQAADGVSYEGVQPHVISAAATLARNCGCEVTVTAATNGTHSEGAYSHGNGYKLDLRTRDNPALVNYVKSLPSAGSWGDGTPLHSEASTCGTYAVESDHVDVIYKPNCTPAGF